MIYLAGQQLEVGKKYTASFVSGVGNVIAGSPASQLAVWEKGLPWIKGSSWVDGATGSGYSDWNFVCAESIDAGALSQTLEAVLQTFDPLSQWEFTQLADYGEGQASQSKGGGCSFNNLDACFAGAKSVLIWGTVALVLIVFLASGGPGLIRGATGK